MIRINPRLVATLIAISILAAGAGGLRSVASAQGKPPPTTTAPAAPQSQPATPAPAQQDQVDVQGQTEQPDAPNTNGASGQPETNEAAATEGTGQPDANEAVETAALAAKAKISQKDAEAAVLAANPGTTISQTRLHDDHGTVVYEMKLSNGSEAAVDAQTGTVLLPDSNEQNEHNGQNETAQPGTV